MTWKHWSTLATCLTLSACGGDNDEGNNRYSYPALDNRPTYFEVCNTSNRQVALRLCTQSLYGCYNYHIEHTASVTDESIAIRLLGARLQPKDACLTAAGPAFAERFLNRPTGTYTRSFNKRLEGPVKWTQDKDSYHLIVTGESTYISPGLGRFTRAVFQCNARQSFYGRCQTRERWISKNREEYERLKVQAAGGSLQAATQLRDHVGEVEHLWRLASGGSEKARAELKKRSRKKLK